SGAAGPTGVAHHSMGGHDWREDHENDLRNYANFVMNAAQRSLAGTSMPLVLVADERLHGMLRASSEYPLIVKEGITKHPGSLKGAKSRDLGYVCLDRAF